MVGFDKDPETELSPCLRVLLGKGHVLGSPPPLPTLGELFALFLHGDAWLEESDARVSYPS